MTMNFVLFNNKIVPKENAILSPVDDGILIGDGVFTTLLVQNGVPILIEEHCKRLYFQARKLNLQIVEISFQSIHELLIRNKAKVGTYRLKLCYIAQGDFFQKNKSTTLVGVLSPYALKKDPLRLLPYPYPIETPFSQYKTLAYSHRFFLLQWAISQQFDDVITIESRGYILESAFANIFWFIGNTFYYPASRLPVFPGITIEIIKKIVSSWEGYSIQPTYRQIRDITTSEQWFIASSLLGIKPIVQIGSVHLARNHALEQYLCNAYKKFIAIHHKDLEVSIS